MTLLLGIVTVAAFAVTMGELLPYLFGHPVVADLVGSAFILSSFAVTGTISGLTVAVFAILVWTLFIRAGRFLFGYKRLSFEGETGYGRLAAATLTTGFKWIRASMKGLFVSGEVEQPNYGAWAVVSTPGLFTRKEVRRS